LKLVQLKENTDDVATAQKIRDILFPMEYTRLDRIIDVMFTTVTDAEPASSPESDLQIEPDEKGLHLRLSTTST
jgi:hypothetical protein